MSFLAGRLAGKEAAYFFQETKHAVNRLAEKSTTKTANHAKNLPSSPVPSDLESQADVLPEIMRHSLPSYIYSKPSDSSSSLSAASKWALHSDPNKVATVSSNALNPLRAYLSLPQVTFGPKRWELPSQESSVMASTANEMRKDRYTPVNPEKLKAAAEGLANVGKAFIVATVLVFGGATLMFSLAVSKLQLHHTDEIRSKGKDLVQPKLEMIREQLVPLKTWAEESSKKWQINRENEIKEKPIIKELSKYFGPKTSN
ncbi:hypothetical protein JCGZ_13731 [Jatropha curcas]|uniref:Uncharacterized protein n=1 Tax=Jatropha curcas TaxID=180498 RepID=A0A067K713_JATCU|nr:uncharacterized protein LOC105640839 [Jatropha curcas]KDP30788.1 hypothetical protein JCGZ_13731 [Jatropha curcas]